MLPELQHAQAQDDGDPEHGHDVPGREGEALERGAGEQPALAEHGAVHPARVVRRHQVQLRQERLRPVQSALEEMYGIIYYPRERSTCRVEVLLLGGWVDVGVTSKVKTWKVWKTKT